jgi:hypothetical protein
MSELVRAMLGPGRAEVDCDECFRLLDQYAERELESQAAAVQYPQMAAHLQGCPVCREEYDSLLALLTNGRANEHDA